MGMRRLSEQRTSHAGNPWVTELLGQGAAGLLSQQRPSGGIATLGSAWGNDVAWTQASAVQDTWYPISDTDMSDGQLSGVAHDGSGKLTVTKAGRYLVSYGLCVECSIVNKHVETGISVNGTVADAGRNHFETLIASAEIPVGCTAILSLAASATVEIAVRVRDTGTPDLNVGHLNFSVVQVGG